MQAQARALRILSSLSYFILQKCFLRQCSNTGLVMCMSLPSDSINSFSIRPDLMPAIFDALPKANDLLYFCCKNSTFSPNTQVCVTQTCVLGEKYCKQRRYTDILRVLRCDLSSTFFLILLQLLLQILYALKLLLFS